MASTEGSCSLSKKSCWSVRQLPQRWWSVRSKVAGLPRVDVSANNLQSRAYSGCLSASPVGVLSLSIVNATPTAPTASLQATVTPTNLNPYHFHLCKTSFVVKLHTGSIVQPPVGFSSLFSSGGRSHLSRPSIDLIGLEIHWPLWVAIRLSLVLDAYIQSLLRTYIRTVSIYLAHNSRRH